MYIKKRVLLGMLAICWMWYVFISLPVQLTLNAAQNLNFVINDKCMTQRQDVQLNRKYWFNYFSWNVSPKRLMNLEWLPLIS